jgi:hypothetical protein
LRPFLNLASDDDWISVVAWLLGALRGRGPYPPLIALGEQDAGKSSGARILRNLIDPNVAPLRSTPRGTRDLMIAATNAHVLSFDNLSGLSRELSDDLCRLATGSGFSTRTLYENREEEIFDAARPMTLNGITLAPRPDLVSRALFINCPQLRDRTRRPEDDLTNALAKAHSGILGALLDAVVVALQRESTVTIESLPRMADFARWVVAAEPACPWSRGQFLKAYARNRQDAVEAILDGDIVADVVQALCAESRWQGTATELLEAVNARASEAQRRAKDWFTQPRQVSDALRRLAPALRRVGVDVRFFRLGRGRTRVIELTREGQGTSASSASVPDALDGPVLTDRADADGAASPNPLAPSSAPVIGHDEETGEADVADAPRLRRGQGDRWVVR